jgi:hypothetical protein
VTSVRSLARTRQTPEGESITLQFIRRGRGDCTMYVCFTTTRLAHVRSCEKSSTINRQADRHDASARVVILPLAVETCWARPFLNWSGRWGSKLHPSLLSLVSGRRYRPLPIPSVRTVRNANCTNIPARGWNYSSAKKLAMLRKIDLDDDEFAFISRRKKFPALK